jgi:hypothetical protein
VSGLLSTSQLNALSKLVKQGMTTDLVIWDHVIEESDNGTEETWVERGESIKGWFHSTPTPVMTVGSGLQGTVNTHRLFLELGTDIENGDRVYVGTDRFTVEDTTHEDTIQAMLTVSLRRID